jgi:hypothetical protein
MRAALEALQSWRRALPSAWGLRDQQAVASLTAALSAAEAAQPTHERKPLTDREIGMAVYGCDNFSSDTVRIARAIERAHGITGEPK